MNISCHTSEQSLTITGEKCYPGDRDDNLWVTLNNYKVPETQAEWEETCFLDKTFHGYYTWPKMIKYHLNKRIRYTRDIMPEHAAIIYDHFINKNFVIQLTESMLHDENEGEMILDRTRFMMYKGLFRNFGMAFVENFMEQLYVLIRKTQSEENISSHQIAAEIVAGMIRGSKYWTLEMLDELWTKLKPFLTEVVNNLNQDNRFYWGSCFRNSMRNQDPRRLSRLIDFICALINHSETKRTTFHETSRWHLAQTLRKFQWRIPSVWCMIHSQAKQLLDHPYKRVRVIIADLLAQSISYDITLPNGKSTRNPRIDPFIDDICEQLHRAIEIYEKYSLANTSDQFADNDSEFQKILNFIDTVIHVHTYLFDFCQQPVTNATIRLFSYLCEIESIVTKHDCFEDLLDDSRTLMARTYMPSHLLKALIEQFEKVCMSPKWHARRAAMKFIQNLVFYNFFNARPYVKQVHDVLLRGLIDEKVEVRTMASMTLAGFYQCGYIQLSSEDQKYFDRMSQTHYFTRVNNKKVISPENLIKRHGGILGLCAIVLSSPYEISMYVPDAFVILCEHMNDPDVIHTSIKKCLSEFRRTHHNLSREYQDKLTEHQLTTVKNTFFSYNYFV